MHSSVCIYNVLMLPALFNSKSFTCRYTEVSGQEVDLPSLHHLAGSRDRPVSRSRHPQYPHDSYWHRMGGHCWPMAAVQWSWTSQWPAWQAEEPVFQVSPVIPVISVCQVTPLILLSYIPYTIAVYNNYWMHPFICIILYSTLPHSTVTCTLQYHLSLLSYVKIACGKVLFTAGWSPLYMLLHPSKSHMWTISISLLV